MYVKKIYIYIHIIYIYICRDTFYMLRFRSSSKSHCNFLPFFGPTGVGSVLGVVSRMRLLQARGGQGLANQGLQAFFVMLYSVI